MILQVVVGFFGAPRIFLFRSCVFHRNLLVLHGFAGNKSTWEATELNQKFHFRKYTIFGGLLVYLVWLSGVFLDLGSFRDHWMTPILRQSNNCKCMVLWRDFLLIVHCLSWDFWWPLLFGSFSEGLLWKFHKRSFTRFMWLSRPGWIFIKQVNWVIHRLGGLFWCTECTAWNLQY